MIKKRIIACLDVKDGLVVKGVKFLDHKVMGSIFDFALRYQEEGADEIVFYDIVASSRGTSLDYKWISELSAILEIPFCVAGGIRDVATAKNILNRGADKISVNSPALERPALVRELSSEFGSQCVVVSVDSKVDDQGLQAAFLYTGDPARARSFGGTVWDWLEEVQELGAGEIVFNAMDADGIRTGYDLPLLKKARERVRVPLIASGGAGSVRHFIDVFQKTNVDAALAAGALHRRELEIPKLKKELAENGLDVRL